jgi:hypothetical protein
MLPKAISRRLQAGNRQKLRMFSMLPKRLVKFLLIEGKWSATLTLGLLQACP